MDINIKCPKCAANWKYKWTDDLLTLPYRCKRCHTDIYVSGDLKPKTDIDESNKTLMRANYQDIILELQSELTAYKIAVKYFADHSDQNKDIVKNLLKEVGG